MTAGPEPRPNVWRPPPVGAPPPVPSRPRADQASTPAHWLPVLAAAVALTLLLISLLTWNRPVATPTPVPTRTVIVQVGTP